MLPKPYLQGALASRLKAKQRRSTTIASHIPFVSLGDGETTMHFAHANAYPPQCYRRLLHALGRENRVLAMEQRPLWDTDLDGFDSWEPMIEDQIEFLTHHAGNPVVAIGHSLGGVITLMAAARRPDLYSHLVLLDPVFLTGFKSQVLKLIPPRLRHIIHPYISGAKRRRFRWNDRDQAIKHFRSKNVFEAFDDQGIADLVDGGLVTDDDGLTLKFTREWEVRIYETVVCDPWKYLRKIEKPVYGLVGSKSDTLFDKAITRWRKHPHSVLDELPYGHLFPMEVPEQTAAKITGFLK
ncbi:MAG: alpha/beta hydrolase [Pseudomonadota bacterium]